MSRCQQLLFLLATCSLLSGCSMCCDIFDYDYPVFDSRYSRMDPQYGRVGSIFSDPNVGPGSPALTNADVPDEPEKKDEESDALNLDTDEGTGDRSQDNLDPDTGGDANTTLRMEREQQSLPRWR